LQPIEGGRVVKKNERDNRRAIAEQMRKAQQRRERQRSLLILGACVLVVVALLGSAVYVYWQDQREASAAAASPLAELGVSESAAGCQEIKVEKVDLKAQTDGTYHVPIGSTVDYADAPPAFGYHWANFLAGSELRTFYTPDDRPEVERLVHSLEHGHTILWYDDSIKKGSEAYKQIQQIGDKLGLDSYLIAAPWKATDGNDLPAGSHLALTHWTGPQQQEGVTQYCAKPSGQVIADFLKKYPKTDAPEPGAV
jgi:Protein of unknown function (DUF3105)